MRPEHRAPLPKPAPLPSFIPPQLATLVTAPPIGDGWLHETKFDGYRIQCRLDAGRATLSSRTGRDWSAQFPEIVKDAGRLSARTAILDGEVAVLLPNGTTSFQALQNALSGEEQGRLVYFVFDLLHLDGHDLRAASLEDRKEALERLLGPRTRGSIRYSSHVVGQGEAFFRQACRLGLEGIVSKQLGEPYRSVRSRGWLKVKCGQEQEFVVAGFTEPKGTRTGIGALLVGVHDDTGALLYAGKVGTGFTSASARSLRQTLDRLRVPQSPFRHRPPGAADARWVQPKLVAEVGFTEWTDDGRLRHPVFKGLREDKAAQEIVRERPQVPSVTAPRGRRARGPA